MAPGKNGMFELEHVSDDEPALEQAIMITAAQKTLAYLADHQTIGLTKTSTFQRYFVHWAARNFEWPHYEEKELLAVNQVLNEDDFAPLWELHYVLLQLKLIRHDKLKCRLTRAGAALVDRPGALFNLIAPFYLFEVDHSDWVRRPERLPGDWAGFLRVLNDEAAKGVTCAQLRATLYGSPQDESLYDRVPGMLWSQVIRPLCWLGLLSEPQADRDRSILDRRYALTPLWTKALKFPLAAFPYTQRRQ